MLQDPVVLARVTPGISELEPTGENTFTSIAKVKIGPVSGSFKGTVELADITPPKQFTLKMNQNSKIGNVNAEGTIILVPLSESQTEVQFAGDARLSGVLARTGQRVVSGVAKSMTAKFFKALSEECSSSA